MSAPLKNTSKNLKNSQSALDDLKKAQSKFKAEANKATRKVEDQTEKIQELIKVHGEDSAEVKKAKEKLEEYTKAMKEAKKASSEAAKATENHAKAHKQLQRKISDSQKAFKDFSGKITRTVDRVLINVTKAGVALASSIGSIGVGVGFSEAFDMEGYKMQLITATKDTEKAGQLMAKAVKFANSTPFETGEVVEATAKMEAYGISSEKWLSDVADMAGATNKSINQATEAMADAVVGEFERMKEFGIKKEQIIERATKISSKAIVSGKKGEAAKRKAIEEALQQIMREKFKGGAEAQAKTFKGMWSTITGVTKSALAKIVGMNENGTIRTGSLYEKLKDKMQLVIDILNRWLEDGTIEKIAEQFTKAVEQIINVISKVAAFIIKYQEWIKTFLVFAGAFYSVVKAIQLYNAVMTIAAIATALVSSPIFLIVTAIAAVVAIAYKLGILDDIFKVIMATVKGFISVIMAIPEGIKMVFNDVFGWITSKIDKFTEKWKKLKKFFGFGKDESSEEKEGKPIVSTPKVTPANTGILPSFDSSNTLKDSNTKAKTPKVIEKIIEKENKAPITLTITGDVYGFEDFKEKVAEAIVKMQQVNNANVVA